MSVNMSEIFFSRWLQCGDVVVSFDDTGEETSLTTVGAGKGTDSEREINSDAVTRSCGEKQGTDSKNVTSTDTKYFLVDGLQHRYPFEFENTQQRHILQIQETIYPDLETTPEQNMYNQKHAEELRRYFCQDIKMKKGFYYEELRRASY